VKVRGEADAPTIAVKGFPRKEKLERILRMAIPKAKNLWIRA